MKTSFLSFALIITSQNVAFANDATVVCNNLADVFSSVETSIYGEKNVTGKTDKGEACKIVFTPSSNDSDCKMMMYSNENYVSGFYISETDRSTWSSSNSNNPMVVSLATGKIKSADYHSFSTSFITRKIKIVKAGELTEISVDSIKGKFFKEKSSFNCKVNL